MLDTTQMFIPRTVTDAFATEVKSRIDMQEDPNQVYAVYYSGDGEIIFKNGNQYKGDIHKGLLSGQGQMLFHDGTLYQGDFNMNKLSGKGKIQWPDGCTYEGEFLEGIRHGKGTFHNPLRESVYEGDWVKGKRQGQGKLRLKDGSEYTGGFVNGVKSGTGKITYPSGNYYQGLWANGVKEGHGEMHWVALKQKYEGQWKNDHPCGIGTLIWVEESGVNKVLRNRYSGFFSKGLRHGLGTFYYANGSTYEGYWQENKKHGYALYTDENGEVNHCFFANDRMVRKIHVADSLLNCLANNQAVKSKYSKFKSQKELGAKSAEDSLKGTGGKDNENTIASNVSMTRGPAVPIPVSNSVAYSASKPPKDGDATVSQDPKKPIESPRSRAAGAASTNNQAGKPTQTPPVPVPAGETPSSPPNDLADTSNIYFQLIDVDDFISEENCKKLLLSLSEVMLRYHSQMKQWYAACTASNERDYAEGFFMDQSSLWKFIINNRLCNAKFSIANLCRLLSRYGSKEFDLHFNEGRLIEEMDLIKKYDFESNDIENELSRFEDKEYVSGKIESLLLEDLAYTKKRRENQYNPNKILLFRTFINALIRMVYLKTGSTFKLASHIEKILHKRVTPLMAGEIKPKKIVHEEGPIISKSKAVLEKYTADVRRLFNVGRNKGYKFAEGHLIDFRTCLLLFRELGILKYETLQEKHQTWMIMERLHDPEESIFRLVTKLIQKGKADDRIDSRIKIVIVPKLHLELTFEEFTELFVLFVAKSKDISPKLTTFANKLNNILKVMFEAIGPTLKKMKKKEREPRVFPMSKKDEEFNNIELLKEQRAKQQEMRVLRQKRMAEEANERALMKLNDMDIDDFLISPKKDIDAFEQEDDSEDDYDAANDGESFFEVIDKDKEKTIAQHVHH